MQKGHDYAIDWWSLGLLLCEVTTGHNPFKDLDKAKGKGGSRGSHFNTLKNIVSASYSVGRAVLRRTQLPGRPPLSDLCKGFILQLLTRDVKRRLGCGGEGAEEMCVVAHTILLTSALLTECDDFPFPKLTTRAPGEHRTRSKKHPWFTRHAARLAGVDLRAGDAARQEGAAASSWWLRVESKKVEPTFKPMFNSDRDDDVSNFDSVFTRETKLLSESISRSGLPSAKAKEAVTKGAGTGAAAGENGGAGGGGGAMDMFGFNWVKAGDKNNEEDAAARAAAEAEAKAKAANEFRGFSFAQSQSMSVVN